MSDDPHTPTTAAPTPPVPTTPVVTASVATAAHPAGSAAPGPAGSVAFGGSSSPLPSERPEVIVGAAFAGGFVVAMILKRLGH